MTKRLFSGKMAHMRQSKLFTKTRKEARQTKCPKMRSSLSVEVLFTKKWQGFTSYLPLGLRVLKKIENIIREEMNAIGGQEVLMSSLQPKKIGKKPDAGMMRWMDNWFKVRDYFGREVGILVLRTKNRLQTF